MLILDLLKLVKHRDQPQGYQLYNCWHVVIALHMQM